MMEKWNKKKQEEQLSLSQRRMVKKTLYRIFVCNDVGIAHIENGEVKVSQVWDYVCRMAGVK